MEKTTSQGIGYYKLISLLVRKKNLSKKLHASGGIPSDKTGYILKERECKICGCSIFPPRKTCESCKEQQNKKLNLMEKRKYGQYKRFEK